MDAFDFAKPHNPQPGQKTYCFGVDPKKWSYVLRQMADALDSGDLGAQEATVWSRASQEDWTLTTVILKFAEKVNVEQRKIDEVEAALDGKTRLKNLWVNGPNF